MVFQVDYQSLTEVLANVLGKEAGGAESDDLVVLIELAEGHAQAVIREDQEDLIQEVRQVYQLQL